MAVLDALVIGGGFYGSAIAVYLARQRGFNRIVLAEREKGLLTRASYNNQARVHNGYHYPRSVTTAYRSRINLPRFVHDWPTAVRRDFTKLYAIARRNSKVTARQFQRFCEQIGAFIEPAEPALATLFDPILIEAVFLVQEYAFDSTRLAEWAARELVDCGVRIRTETTVSEVRRATDHLDVTLRTRSEAPETLSARYVFNCTYSGLNQIGGDLGAGGGGTRIKQEITEMALVETPPELRELGVTVMDGPFFSIMPFPSRSLHTLSHVRYTPHMNWPDERGVDPCAKLAAYHRETRAERMIRDASRYLPAIARVRAVDSLFEVKTLLLKNENDDGRPILFLRHPEAPGCFSILGGKIDNIYDILEQLDKEPLPIPADPTPTP